MVNDLLPCLDRGQVAEDLSRPVVGSLAFGLVCKTIPSLLPIHNGTLRSRTLFHKGGGKDGLPGIFVSQSLYQVHLTVQTNGKMERLIQTYKKHRNQFNSANEFKEWYNRRIHGALILECGETSNDAFVRKIEARIIGQCP
jgi:hypothetical protein